MSLRKRYYVGMLLLFFCTVQGLAAPGPGTVIKGISEARALASRAERLALLQAKNPGIALATLEALATRLGETAATTVPHTAQQQQRAQQEIVQSMTGKQVQSATAADYVQQAKTAVSVPDVSAVVADILVPVEAEPPMRSGYEVLTHYFPTWRQGFARKFSSEQLDAVEQAFLQADEIMFTRSEDGILQARSKAWNYEEQFDIELMRVAQARGLTFTQAQLKQLHAGKNASLLPVFKFTSYENFLLVKERPPRDGVYGKTKGELSPAQRAERDLYNDVQNLLTRARNSGYADRADIVALNYFKKEFRVLKTPAQWFEKVKAYYEEFGRLPRKGIFGKKAAEYTPAERAETQMRNGLDSAIDLAKKGGYEDRADIVEIRAWREARMKVPKRRSAEEWYEEMVKLGYWPKRNIYTHQLTPKEEWDVVVAKGISHALNDGVADPALVEKIRQFRLEHNEDIRLTHAQVREELFTYLVQTHTYPFPSINLSLYSRIWKRFKYGKKNPDGTFQDPDLQALYELDQLARAAQAGERPWDFAGGETPAPAKRRRPRIGEKKRAQAVEGKPLLEEGITQITDPAVLKTYYERLPASTQQALRKTEEFAETALENFPTWLRGNFKYLILTPQTNSAFKALTRNVDGPIPDEITYETVVKLAQLRLGIQPDGKYNRIIYRGENPNIPSTDQFHLVSEIQGVPKEFAQSALAAREPHVFIDTEGDFVHTLVLSAQTSPEELERVILAMTPQGWSVRVGSHELGLVRGEELTPRAQSGILHVHIEKEVLPEDIEDADISYVLHIDASPLVTDEAGDPLLDTQQQISLYKRLLGRFLPRRN